MQVNPPRDGDRVRFDPHASAFGIAASLMKQRYWALLTPSLIFMGVSLFLALWAIFTLASNHESAGQGATDLIVIASVLLPAMWVWVRCVVMLTATAYLRGEEPGFGQMNAIAMQRLPAALGASALSAMLVAIFYWLFIVPGVIASVRKWFVLPAVLFENTSAFGAGTQSANATRGRFWQILLGGFLGGIAGIVAFIVAGVLIYEIISSPEFSLRNAVLIFLLIMSWPVIGTLTSVQRVVQYWKFTTDLKTVSLRRRGPSPLGDDTYRDGKPVAQPV